MNIAETLSSAIAAERTDATSSRPRIEAQLAQIAADIKKSEKAIDRYLGAFEAGTLPEAQCGERGRGLGQRLADLRARQADVLAEFDDLGSSMVPEPDLDAIGSGLSDLLHEDVLPGARTAAIQRLVEAIRVDSREVIHPTFPVPTTAAVRIVHPMVEAPGIEPDGSLNQAVSLRFTLLSSTPRTSQGGSGRISTCGRVGFKIGFLGLPVEKAGEPDVRGHPAWCTDGAASQSFHATHYPQLWARGWGSGTSGRRGPTRFPAP